MAKDFNKVTAFDELIEIFRVSEKPTFSEQMKSMQDAQNYIEIIHLEGYQQGLEAGLKKIDLENDHN
jgi:hypothetical protein